MTFISIIYAFTSLLLNIARGTGLVVHVRSGTGIADPVHVVELAPSATGADVRAQLPAQFRTGTFSCQGRELQDQETLADAGVCAQSELLWQSKPLADYDDKLVDVYRGLKAYIADNSDEFEKLVVFVWSGGNGGVTKIKVVYFQIREAFESLGSNVLAQMERYPSDAHRSIEEHLYSRERAWNLQPMDLTAIDRLESVTTGPNTRSSLLDETDTVVPLNGDLQQDVLYRMLKDMFPVERAMESGNLYVLSPAPAERLIADGHH